MRDRLTLLHDADGLVAVDKPAGYESTGRTVDDPAGVQHWLRQQLGRPVWLAHQLDRDTTGVLLFVRKKRLVAEVQRQLRAGHKRYLALAEGTPSWRARVVEHALAYDRTTRRWVVREDGKPARTRFRCARRGHDAALIEATPATGRTHQIRVHLAHLGHPLIGERRYRVPESTATARHMLHAWRIELGERTIESAPPTDFEAAMKRLGLEGPLSG